jgi:hypothetical protein
VRWRNGIGNRASCRASRAGSPANYRRRNKTEHPSGRVPLRSTWLYRRILSLRRKWRPYYAPKLKKRTALFEKLREIFRQHVSWPVEIVIAKINRVWLLWNDAEVAANQQYRPIVVLELACKRPGYQNIPRVWHSRTAR